MTRILSIAEAHEHLALLPSELTQGANPEVAIITDGGNPVLAILPWDFYDSLFGDTGDHERF
jgi:hypothetical protein